MYIGQKGTEKGVYKMYPSGIIDSLYVVVEIHDLTFLRCDYKFSYVIEVEGARFVLGTVNPSTIPFGKSAVSNTGCLIWL